MRLALAATLAGCAGPAPVDAFAVRVSWQALPFACPARAGMGAQMEAFLAVSGGFAPCELSVSPLTLTVSGTCSEITTGCFRPLALGYRMNNGAGVRAALAYLVGAVDLREEALAADEDDVLVNLVADGTQGELVFTNAVLAGWPDATNVRPCFEAGARGLDDAKVWAKEYLTGEQVTFDNDVDTISNLEEACAGTLFP